MQSVSHVDDHVRAMAASPEQTWIALLRTVRTQFGHQPWRWLAAAWGLEHPARNGDWINSVSVGDTIPGFAVSETDPPRLLVLHGRHRFSRYELRFELDQVRRGCIEVHAKTSAEFPGARGRIYRALVISSGGHRIAVRRILTLIAQRAEQSQA